MNLTYTEMQYPALQDRAIRAAIQASEKTLNGLPVPGALANATLALAWAQIAANQLVVDTR